MMRQCFNCSGFIKPLKIVPEGYLCRLCDTYQKYHKRLLPPSKWGNRETKVADCRMADSKKENHENIDLTVGQTIGITRSENQQKIQNSSRPITEQLSISATAEIFNVRPLYLCVGEDSGKVANGILRGTARFVQKKDAGTTEPNDILRGNGAPFPCYVANFKVPKGLPRNYKMWNKKQMTQWVDQIPLLSEKARIQIAIEEVNGKMLDEIATSTSRFGLDHGSFSTLQLYVWALINKTW